MSDEPWWRKIGKVIGLGFKMLAAQLLLFAPALACYLLALLLGNILEIGPAWLVYIPMLLMLFTGISAVVRLPMAMSVLAKGGTITEALDWRFVKLLISAAFGRYIVSMLVLLFFVILTLFTGYMNFFIAWAYSGLITAWMVCYLGYVTNRCYDAAAARLGLPAPPPPAEPGGVRMPQMAKSAVSVLLVLAIVGQMGAMAFNEDEELASGNYPTHSYTTAEYQQALEQFSRSGQLNKTRR
jgi:hypothetical protein